LKKIDALEDQALFQIIYSVMYKLKINFIFVFILRFI